MPSRGRFAFVPVCGLLVLLHACAQIPGAEPGSAVAVFEASGTRVSLTSSPWTFSVAGRGAAVTLSFVRYDDGNAGARLQWLASAAQDGSIIEARVDSDSAPPRQFTVRIDLSDPASIPVSILPSGAPSVAPQARGRTSMELSFAGSGEHVYGVQMYPEGGALDNRGRAFSLAGGRLGMRGGDWFSVRAPFFLVASDPAWGFWADTLKTGAFRFPRGGGAEIRIDDALSDDPQTGPAGIRFRLLRGQGPAEVLALFARPDAGGGSRVPPDWAFAPLWWRDDFHDDARGVSPHSVKSGRVTDVGATALADLAAFTRLGIPVGTVQLDRPSNVASAKDEELPGYGTLTDGSLRPDMEDPAAEIAQLGRGGVHVLTWTSDRLVGDIRAQAVARGLTYPDSSGALDVARPEASDFWASILGPLVTRLGMAGYMMDRGEEDGIPALAAPGGGPRLKRVSDVPPRAVNAAAVQYPMILNRLLTGARGPDFFLYGRNLYDRGRQYANAWNGDTRGWEGLRETVKHQLRAGLIGFPILGSDVGGYRHPLWGYRADPELYLRWMQLAAFSTQMHIVLWPNLTPWYDFGQADLATFVRYARLKVELLPYVRSLAALAARTGLPAVRPLFLELGLDTANADLWEEYFLGDDVLVAPVTRPGQTEQTVELPPGLWADFWDLAKVLQGGRSIKVRAPRDTIPAFIREGAIIPRGDIVPLSTNRSPDWRPRLDVLVFPSPSRPGSFHVNTDSIDAEMSVEAGSARVTLRIDATGVATRLTVLCEEPASVEVDGAPAAAGTWSYDARQRVALVDLAGAAAHEVVLESASAAAAGPSGVRAPGRLRVESLKFPVRNNTLLNRSE